MTFRQNLKHARSHIVFISALCAGFALVMFLEQPTPAAAADSKPDVIPPAMDTFTAITPLPVASPRPLTPTEIGYAQTAWTYFENNTNSETGLVNSANAYPSTTMWETGAYFTAIVAADLVGILDHTEAEQRLSRALGTLAGLELFQGTLPNKAYHTRTAAMVDYANQPTELGLGWSALDVARMISALGLVKYHYPALAPEVAAVFDAWDVSAMVRDGQLYGTNIVDGEIQLNQEGRVGYEQYAARGMQRFGHDMFRAYQTGEKLMIQTVEGVQIPVDTRLHRGETPAFTVSEPYILDGLEFGFDSRSHRFASQVYRAQEQRHASSGILTAVSESHVSGPPYFVYSTIWGGGDDWAVMAFNGERHDDKRTVATKIAFAWGALFDTDYTSTLIEAVADLGDPKAGWAEGIYEASGETNSSVTANTNAIVLAALAYRAFGPLSHAKQ